jgi:hypothetical protein
LRNLSNCLVAAVCMLAIAPTSFAQQPADINAQAKAGNVTGSYRLTGVMETASRLQLEADGTYKWMMAVGGLDLYSEGKWTQTNGQVILGRHQFDSDTAVFTLGSSYVWGREESTAAYEMEHIRLKNRAKWNCAFLAAGGYFSSSGESIFPKDLPPLEKHQAAVKIEREMYDAYEKAIGAYFDRDMSSTDDNPELAARTARQNWEHAVAFLAESGRAVGKTGNYQPPPLPAECLFLSDYTPDYAENQSSENVNWNWGVGIWVNRRDRPNARLDIDAEFSFTDGSVEMANSYELGFAFAPASNGRQLQSIKLTLRHEEKEYSSRFDVPTDRRARVYEVKLDNRVFVKPPFEELRLAISGDRLKSVDGSRGYYIKTN